MQGAQTIGAVNVKFSLTACFSQDAVYQRILETAVTEA